MQILERSRNLSRRRDRAKPPVVNAPIFGELPPRRARLIIYLAFQDCWHSCVKLAALSFWARLFE